METTKVNKTEAELAASRKENKKIADEYAQMNGKKDIKEITEPIADMIKAGGTKKVMGEKAAAQVITDLAQLILYQEIETMSLPSTYDLVEKANDGYIANGNAKEYVVDLLTGHETYEENMFNPDAQTDKFINSHIIQMYDANKKLNAKAYQYRKELTIPEGKYIPYFLSGKLNELLNNLRSQIYKAYKIFMSNKLFELITTTEYQKTIEGKALNLFDCLTQEVLPEFNNMQLLNNEYNIKATEYIDTARPEDLLIFTSNKIKTLIQTGIKTQLFNAQLLAGEGKVLTSENLICLGNKLTLATQKDVLVDSGVPWVDDNTIFVVDITGFKHLLQLNKSASQFYAKNITLYIVLHIWGALDGLPWKKGFKYTNPNLSKLPE